ncbi:MAG TPA: transglutaminaseTgpA domain-containing protein [Pirellulales bacterium]|nr:transglutaminaseTgpA domain-containing protein [Pirellulales bacterium]
MRIERLLQISIAALVSLSTLLLGMGERDLTLPVVAVLVSAGSLYLTDVKGWLQLNATVTNIAGLLALAATYYDWDYFGAESQLLSMAHLLIYLQFVLLFRKKDLRNYWLLVLLSLLETAVASALNMSIFFGLLLLIYMFAGLITLAVFSIYREYRRGLELWEPWRKNEDFEPSQASRERRRWPLGSLAPVFAGRPLEAEADAGLNWAWTGQVLKLSCLTLILSSMLFFALPRVGKVTRWRTSSGRALRTVGFSETVTLGELGEAYENDNALMEVWFQEEGASDGYRVAGDGALFRGALLCNYQNGQWQRRSELSQGRRQILPTTSESDLATEGRLVKQKIKLQPRDDATLFSVYPIINRDEKSQIRYSDVDEQIYRPRNQRGAFDYELYTSGFRDHLYSMAIPAMRTPGEREFIYELEQMPDRNADGDGALTGLRQLAKDLVAEIPSIERERRARALEMHLRDPSKFQYSLKSVDRDRKLDPIEDFITKHPVGHCEYFATALTLMLRSVGIPARLAIGFKGGEWNEATESYTVRELHAHTWVEAYVRPDSLPNFLKNSKLARENGAWLLLDPTPGGEDDERYGVFGLYSWKQLLDLSQFLWSNYVLGMDSQRQQEAIYQPLIQRIEDQLRRLGDDEYRQEQWAKLNAKLGGQRFGLAEGWLSWQGLLATASGLLLAVGVFKGSQRALPPLRRWARNRWDRALGRTRAGVRFYQRFEDLLARRQLLRAANQTPREFALSVGGQFAESPATQRAAVLPRRIVEAFYRVRFGGAALDNTELQAVEQALSELADVLKAAESATDATA